MGVYGELLKLNDRKPVAEPQRREEKPPVPVEESSNRTQTQSAAVSTHHDTTTPRNRGSMVSRYHDAMIEVVRAAVKLFGKEAATHRFTVQEKKAIADIVYTYKRDDIRTSENEITRISVNFILSDYEANGESSILNRVLKALNS